MRTFNRRRKLRAEGLSFSQKRLRSGDDLIRQFRRWFPTTRWMFRGHANARWLPTSSLDRYCSEYGFPANGKAIVESFFLQDFYRHLPAQEPGLPVTNDLQLLLAMMQHHGTPTRLIDWTYSPFIAAYIALETAKGEAAIWALNGEWLQREANRVVPQAAPHLPRPSDYDRDRDSETFLRLFMPQLMKQPVKPAAFVYTVNPLLLNRRLSIQQGVFTAVGDVTKSFVANLARYKGARENVVKVVIGRRLGRDILSMLHRMGINRSSLLPGLDGFAWSLRTKMHALRQTRTRIQPWSS
ncbi:MAG TPA: FRG domain-containing protein [Burkholderiales bacterium]|nr:FRG domain-containing protein [Burkholderiales bacterium]